MPPKIIQRQTLVPGRVFSFEEVSLQFEDGRIARYQNIHHPGAVTILPVDPEGNILFVEQFRVGSGSLLVELPAGTLGKGEDPLDCANREVREETGYAANSMQHLGAFYLAPGYSSEFMHIYLASDLYESPLPEDDDEELELIRIPVADVYQMASEGKINDGKTLAALMLAFPILYDTKQ